MKIIASFEDGAVPLNSPAGSDRSGRASRSANEGIRYLAAFEDDAVPVNTAETDSLDTLNVLFAQHEQKIQRLVTKLQGMIEDLKKQNADMKRILFANDQVINRYYLDGPREDDI